MPALMVALMVRSHPLMLTHVCRLLAANVWHSRRNSREIPRIEPLHDLAQLAVSATAMGATSGDGGVSPSSAPANASQPADSPHVLSDVSITRIVAAEAAMLLDLVVSGALAVGGGGVIPASTAQSRLYRRDLQRSADRLAQLAVFPLPRAVVAQAIAATEEYSQARLRRSPWVGHGSGAQAAPPD